MHLLSFIVDRMNGFHVFVIASTAYFLAGIVVSFVHPSLLRLQLAELSALRLGPAGLILKPLMGLLVLLLYCSLWPIGWLNAGKYEKTKAEDQAAQLERFRLVWQLGRGMTAPVAYAGGNGSSFEDAVVIIDATILSGPRAEYVYLERHFPGYQCCDQRVKQHKGRTFDVLQFTTASGETKTIYFDISGHLAEPQ